MVFKMAAVANLEICGTLQLLRSSDSAWSTLSMYEITSISGDYWLTYPIIIILVLSKAVYLLYEDNGASFECCNPKFVQKHTLKIAWRCRTSHVLPTWFAFYGTFPLNFYFFRWSKYPKIVIIWGPLLFFLISTIIFSRNSFYHHRVKSFEPGPTTL